MRFLILILVLIVLAAIVFFRPRGAKRRTYEDVAGHLKELKANNDPTAFFGFHTRGVDALYFVHDSGKLFLDYELDHAEKESFAEPFRKAASAKGFSVTTLSYDEVHPVLRIQLSSVETEAAEEAYAMARELFGIDRETELEFLP